MAFLQRLPRPIKPLPDETRLSWAVRLARSNALKFQTLLTLAVDSRRHSLMECDLDRFARDELVSGLAILSGRSKQEIVAQSLSGVLANLSIREFDARHPQRWLLLPVAISRRPTKPWTGLCLDCLRSDPIPYFRNAWRLAFVTTCHIHLVRLIDRCPSCAAPLNFHCLDLAKSHFDTVMPVSYCGECGLDARESAMASRSCDSYASKYERSLYRSARFGKCLIAGAGWTYAGALFEVMHHIIARSRNSMRILYMQDELTGSRNLAPLNPRSIPQGFFHTWTIDARHDAICAFANLMRNWPRTLIAKGIQYGMTSYDARGDETRLPLWFDRILTDNFYRKWWSPSEAEEASVRRLIRAAGEPETDNNVRRWLGMFFEKNKSTMRIVDADRPEQLRLKMRRINCFNKWTDA